MRRTYLYLVAVMCIVAGCRSSVTTQPPTALYELLHPADPLSHERAIDVEVGRCMTAVGLKYKFADFPKDPVKAGSVDSRKRRETAGFGISTGGPNPDEIVVQWKVVGPEESNEYKTQLLTCGQQAEDAVAVQQQARFAALSTEQQAHAVAAETAPSILAAWVGWRVCVAQAGVVTSAHNSAELQADFVERFKTQTDLELFKVEEQHAAVADWDCSQPVTKAVEDFVEES